MSHLSDSQAITVVVIVTGSIVYSLILCGIATLGYFQSKAEPKA